MVNSFVLEARIRRVCEAQPNNVRLRAASTSLTKAPLAPPTRFICFASP